jgi:hypothetical protein
MHLVRKVVRKSVRKVTPRPIRQVNRVVRHPVLTTYQTVAPRPLQSAERSVYNITHPVNAIENKAVNTVIGPPIRWTGVAAPAAAAALAPAAIAAEAVHAVATPARRTPSTSPPPSPHHVPEDEATYENVRRLADRADPSTRPQLVEALKHSDPAIRKLAIRGIGRLHEPVDDPLIAESLADPSDEVRVEAARSAHDRPSEQLRHALSVAAGDKQPLVRQLANEALARLDESPRSVRDPAQDPEPTAHAAEESDPFDLRLALLVASHHGAVTMTVKELLQWLDRKILTVAALDEIEDILTDAGLRCQPRIDDLDINGDVTLVRHEGIPEFELRAHVDTFGPWTMPMHDLLHAFDRHKLTSRARTEIAEALEYADLETEPSLTVVGADDQITISRAG